MSRPRPGFSLIGSTPRCVPSRGAARRGGAGLARTRRRGAMNALDRCAARRPARAGNTAKGGVARSVRTRRRGLAEEKKGARPTPGGGEAGRAAHWLVVPAADDRVDSIGYRRLRYAVGEAVDLVISEWPTGPGVGLGTADQRGSVGSVDLML